MAKRDPQPCSDIVSAASELAKMADGLRSADNYLSMYSNPQTGPRPFVPADSVAEMNDKELRQHGARMDNHRHYDRGNAGAYTHIAEICEELQEYDLKQIAADCRHWAEEYEKIMQAESEEYDRVVDEQNRREDLRRLQMKIKADPAAYIDKLQQEIAELKRDQQAG